MSEARKRIDTESVKRRRLNTRISEVEQEDTQGDEVKSTQQNEIMSERDLFSRKDKTSTNRKIEGAISVPLARRISINESKHRNNRSIFDSSQNSDKSSSFRPNSSNGRDPEKDDASRQGTRTSDARSDKIVTQRESNPSRGFGNGSSQTTSTKYTDRISNTNYDNHDTGPRRYQDRVRDSSASRARERPYSPRRNGKASSDERNQRRQTPDEHSFRRRQSDRDLHTTRDRMNDGRNDQSVYRSTASSRHYDRSRDRDDRKAHTRRYSHDLASDEDRPRSSNFVDSNQARRSRNSPARDGFRRPLTGNNREDRRIVESKSDRPRGRTSERVSRTSPRPSSRTHSYRSSSAHSKHDYIDRADDAKAGRAYELDAQNDRFTRDRERRSDRSSRIERESAIQPSSGRELIKTRFRSPSADHDAEQASTRRTSKSPTSRYDRHRRDSRSPSRGPVRRRPLPDQALLAKDSFHDRPRNRSLDRSHLTPHQDNDRSYGGKPRYRRSPEAIRQNGQSDKRQPYETDRDVIHREMRTNDERNESYSRRQDRSARNLVEAKIANNETDEHGQQRLVDHMKRGRPEARSPRDGIMTTDGSPDEHSHDQHAKLLRTADRRVSKREHSVTVEDSPIKRSKTQQAQLQFRTPESITTPQSGKSKQRPAKNNNNSVISTTVHSTLELEGAQSSISSQTVEISVYERIGQVGEGTYGKVYKARHRRTGEFVALKRIRLEQERDGFPITSMREIKLLQRLKHPSIIKLHEMMIEKGSVYMVFEYMDHDLTGILANPNITFETSHIKDLAHQLFDGLAHLHHRGVLHRDMKGSNILLNNAGELKLADFGLARFYNKSRCNADYTNRVITLWFRPPELLLGATAYDAAVDVWSAGCIFVELFTKTTIFPGRDEIHQLETIYRVMGTPTIESWPGLTQLPWYELIKFEQFPSKFEDMVPMLTPAALGLSLQILQLDPIKRPLAQEILNHDYFTTEEPKAVRRTLLDIVESHEWDTKQRRREDRARKSKEDKDREVQGEDKHVEGVSDKVPGNDV